MFKNIYRKEQKAELGETPMDSRTLVTDPVRTPSARRTTGTVGNETFTVRQKTSPASEKKPKNVIAMVPLLSWRSIIVMAIGLIIGAGLGLGYWIISPSLKAPSLPGIGSGGGSDGGLASVMGVSQSTAGPYESSITIQVVHPDATYISLKDLQRMGEYYAAVANSLPFLQYLNQKLTDEAPEYTHSVADLDQIVQTAYDWNTDLPTIQMKVTAPNAQEALFLPTYVAETFKSYLIAEENEKQLQDYQNTLTEIDGVKAALSQAQEELSSLTLDGAPYGTTDNPDYISVKSEITALEFRLSQLNTMQGWAMAAGSSGENPVEIADISKTLAEDYRKLAIIQANADVKYSDKNLDYKIAQAKVDALNTELTTLITKLSTSLGGSAEVPEIAGYLVLGSASMPSPILPERMRARNALIMGTVVGVGGALIILNFKWITKGMPSSAAKPKEDKEDEEA
jgi:hypothetical protein